MANGGGPGGGGLPQATASQLVKEPLMITLPLSYGIARVISQGLGGATWTIWLAALVVSFLVYLVDWYAQTDWTRKDYYGRLIYVVLNTFIVVGILTGLITLGEAP